MNAQEKEELIANPNGLYREAIPHIRSLEIRVADSGVDYAILRLPYTDKREWTSETGVLHGEAVTPRVDTACGAAVS